MEDFKKLLRALLLMTEFSYMGKYNLFLLGYIVSNNAYYLYRITANAYFTNAYN